MSSYRFRILCYQHHNTVLSKRENHYLVIPLLTRQIKGENNKVSKTRDLAVEERRSSMFPARKMQGYPQTPYLHLQVGT